MAGDQLPASVQKAAADIYRIGGGRVYHDGFHGLTSVLFHFSAILIDGLLDGPGPVQHGPQVVPVSPADGVGKGRQLLHQGIDLPDQAGRKKLIQILCRKNKIIQISESMMDNLAERSIGMSPALIEGAINAAIRDAIRNNGYVTDDIINEAFDFYQRGLIIAKQGNDSSNIAFGLAYLGRIYAKNKDWEKADLYYQKAIELAELIGDDHALKLSVQELTSVYRRQNLLDKALMLVSRLSVYDKNNNYPDNRSRHLIIGNTYLKIGQLDSAYYYIQYAVGSDDIHVRRSSYQALYNLYKQREQYAKATYFNELYIACQDSIESMGKLIDLSLITKEHDERIQKKVIWSKIFCFVGSTVIVLLLLGGLFYWHSRRRWREELERKKEEMEMLEQIEREIVRQLELEQQTHKAVREEADRNLELVLAQENQLKDLHAQKHVLEQEIETLNKKLGEAGIFSALRQIEQQSLFERNMFAFLAEMKVNPRSLLKDEIKDLDLFIGQKYAKERKAHPGMTVTDWRYWLLTRMEFSNENMATLMNVRIDSVYKQKQRVKEHLNQKNKPMSKS